MSAPMRRFLLQRGSLLIIVLLDQNADLAKGKAIDITQSMALIQSDVVVTGTGDYKDTAGSDIVVVTAGVSRKPGMSRDDLLYINAELLSRERIEAVVNKVQHAGSEIVNLLKHGTAYFAPGIAVI